ncbi:hypothetical protein HGRIS_011078 [Hohenbuehelia grisea]|uniref:Uncharacterized protein n=1 Tax=Hohenbuehelia grisea TaxID=104357 RepID=A0ABR3IZ16_9AGAR
MVHRPSDGRLLTNLVSQEKEYSKQYSALFDVSHVSLALFEAYAAASPPPASHFILAVVRSLATAEDALRKYAIALNDSREHLKGLSTLEDHVANIVRDREILVTRLIKASKAQKHPSLTASQFGSSTSLAHSPKLAAAQTELQACEAQLAAKERDLDARRSTAVREALAARCRAMVECGTAWTECGNNALRSLDSWSLGSPSPAMSGNPNSKPPPPNSSALHVPDIPSSLRSESLLSVSHYSNSSISPSQSASQTSEHARHSASFVTAHPPESDKNIGPDDTEHHIYSNFDVQDISTSSASHDHTSTTMSSYGHVLQPSSPLHSPIATPRSQSPEPHPTLNIPPAHAISELTMPTSTVSSPAAVPSGDGLFSGSNISLPVTPTSRGVLPRRITEETLHTLKGVRDEDGNADTGGSSADEPDDTTGHVQIVENPRFARPKAGFFSTSRTSVDAVQNTKPGNETQRSNPSPPAKRRAFSTLLRGHGHDAHPNIPDAPHSAPLPVRTRKTSLFGSIRGLFGSPASGASGSPMPANGAAIRDGDASPKGKGKAKKTSDDDEVHFTAAMTRKKSKRTKKGGAWETRTDRNLRAISNGKGASSSEMDRPGKGKVRKGQAPESSDSESDVGLPVSPSSPAILSAHAQTYHHFPIRPGQPRKASSDIQQASSAQGMGEMHAGSSSTIRLPPGSSFSKRDGGNRLRKSRTVTKKEKPPTKAKGKTVTKDSIGGPQQILVDSQTGGLVEEPRALYTDDTRSSTDVHPSPRRGNSLDGLPSTMSHSAVCRRTLTRQPTYPAPVAHVIGGAEPALQSALSRNSSLRSAASAPPKPRRVMHKRSGSATLAVSGAESADARPGARERRWSGSHAPVGADVASASTSEGPASLMSIVESVARANRAGWAHANANSSVAPDAGTTTSSTISATESGLARARSVGGTSKPLGLLEVRAPPSVGRKELESTSNVAALLDRGTGPGISIPSAPRSVLSHPHAGDVAVLQGRMPRTNGTASASASGTITPSASPPSSAIGRPAKSPLRSALRNSSRTPSPMPVNSYVASSPLPSLVGEKQHANSAILKPEAALPVASRSGDATNARPSSSSLALKGKGKGRGSQDGGDSDSGASISSYETGHEVFDSDGDATEREKERATNDVARTPASEPTLPSQPPPLPAKDTPTPASSTIGSASTISPGSSPPRGRPGAADVAEVRTQRRKSVRVSLHPTFSPTPPALEEDESEHAPWAGPNGWTQNEPVRDMWEDSSDEDVEYQRARRLLSRLAKKAQKA